MIERFSLAQSVLAAQAALGDPGYPGQARNIRRPSAGPLMSTPPRKLHACTGSGSPRGPRSITPGYRAWQGASHPTQHGTQEPTRCLGPGTEARRKLWTRSHTCRVPQQIPHATPDPVRDQDGAALHAALPSARSPGMSPDESPGLARKPAGISGRCPLYAGSRNGSQTRPRSPKGDTGTRETLFYITEPAKELPPGSSKRDHQGG